VRDQPVADFFRAVSCLGELLLEEIEQLFFRRRKKANTLIVQNLVNFPHRLLAD